jgi:hypothetical protein
MAMVVTSRFELSRVRDLLSSRKQKGRTEGDYKDGTDGRGVRDERIRQEL